VADGQHGDERAHRLVERDLHRIAVLGDQPGDGPGSALAELARALDGAEQVGGARSNLRIEDPRQGIHDILGGHLAAVVEAHALPEGERPREPVARRLPELGERRPDHQRLIELDEPVKDLLGHRAAVDVDDARRVERLGVVAERPAIGPARDDDVLSLLRGDRRGLDARERQQEDGEREEGENSPLPPAASQAAVSQAAGLQLG